MAKLETTRGRVLLLALVLLLAGASFGWILGKPYAWQQGYDRALRDLLPLLLQKQRQPAPELRAVPPRWRQTATTTGA